MFHVSDKLQIDLKETQFAYSRSSGPGGQKVNTSNTKVTLRWNVLASDSITERQRKTILEKLESKITEDGELIIHSQRFRDQGRNVADCLEKLSDLLRKALRKPKPRIPTKPTRAQKQRRLDAKKHQSKKKSLRSSIKD